MTESGARSESVRLDVAAAIEAVLDSRGDVPKLRRAFEHSRVPMVMADARRRVVDVNRAARVWLRLSPEAPHTFAIGDLPPSRPGAVIEQPWSRLPDAGGPAGATAGDGSHVSLVHCAVAHITPDRHLIGFAPADWPVSKFDAITDDRSDTSAALTPREIEVLALAANGLTASDLANELSIGRATVRTHLANIYEKLGVRNRAAAIATGMRLGVIE